MNESSTSMVTEPGHIFYKKRLKRIGVFSLKKRRQKQVHNCSHSLPTWAL